MERSTWMVIWIYIHNFIDKAINVVFGLFYDFSYKERVPPVRNPILLKSASCLALCIRNRELSSVAVVTAFIERIREVNKILNAVVDENFEAALQQASEVDRLLDSGSVSKDEARMHKPFLGVPFTVKESSSCKGMNFTIGLVARQGMKGEFDAEVVRLFKNAGGILLGVTNIPEFNMWCETRCHVYGQTSNPYNITRTVGGSSGGEGAILAACGSPFGIGSDVGGSIRMPAFYCGIFGHKPTTGVLSVKGISLRTTDDSETMVCHGPMCRYAEDLEPTLRVLAGNKVSLLQLDKQVNINNLRIMFMEESGDLRASSVSSETRQVMLKVVNYFRSHSSNPVEKIDVRGFEFSFRLWRYWISKESSNFARDITNRQGEVTFWQELGKMLMGCSNHTFPAIMRLCDQKFFPQENPKWAETTKTFLEEQLLEKLGENGVLLYPSHPFPASYHYSSLFRPYNFAYWGIFNVLRLPVTQVPLGLSEDGLPLGIQVVAGPNQDKLCLAVACELEKAFGGWVSPSATIIHKN